MIFILKINIFRGAFSSVRKATIRSSMKPVVVKIVDKFEDNRSPIWEFEVQKDLQHNNILNLIEVFITYDKIYLSKYHPHIMA